MSSTTYPNFDAKTEASAVTLAFADSIRDRTIIITGVNKLGIGYTTALALAKQSPRHLILCARSEAKLQECLKSLHQICSNVNFRSLIIDLSSQQSVRAAAAEALGWEDIPAIDIVINNAGVMSVPKHTVTEDGVELHLATNHVGHFLFTNLIMPKIMVSARTGQHGATRIINVSSMGTMASPFRPSDVNWEKPVSQLPEEERPKFALMRAAGLLVNEDMSYIPIGAYGQSKTANILYSVTLNERLYEKYGILSLAVHPGEIRTELHRTTDPVWLEKTEEWRKKMNSEWKTLEQGPSTALVAALDPMLHRPAKDGHGQFLNDCQISAMAPSYALDKAKAEQLWKITQVQVKETFDW